MRSFHNNAFDPQTLVLLEAAFDEAWLTLKLIGNKTVKPEELARGRVAPGDGRRTQSRSSAQWSAGGTATRDHLARGELIAYFAFRFTAEDFPRFSRIATSDRINRH